MFFFSSKIYDKRDDVNLRIVNFPFLDGDSPRTIRYGVNISHLSILLEPVVMLVALMSKTEKKNPLKQGYRYHKLRKILSKFYRQHYDIISNYGVSLKGLLQQELSEPDF